MELNGNSRNRLQELNIQIEQANEKIAEKNANYRYANQDKEVEKKLPITITNVGQTSRIRKRDRLAKRQKFITVKSGAFYDKMLYARDFIKSFGQSFKSSDTIDSLVEKELEKHAKK